MQRGFDSSLHETVATLRFHHVRARLASFDDESIQPALVVTDRKSYDGGDAAPRHESVQPFSDSYKIAAARSSDVSTSRGVQVVDMDTDSQILIGGTDVLMSNTPEDQWVAPFSDSDDLEAGAGGYADGVIGIHVEEATAQRVECVPQESGRRSAAPCKSPGAMLRNAALTVHAAVKISRAERMKRRAKWATKKLIVFILSHVGLTTIVGLYAVAGGFLFQYLEGERPKQSSEPPPPLEMRLPDVNYTDIRQKHIDSIWNHTTTMNVLHPSEWKARAEEVMINFEQELIKSLNSPLTTVEVIETSTPATKWTYGCALLFSVTIITTIGYGDTVPVTVEGKIATMLYAIIGIPLVLLCLTNIGSFLATTCRFTWKHTLHLGYILTRSPKRNRSMMKTSEVRVPITVSVLTMVIYILSGAAIFSRWENWTFLDGSYFCFITLSTIGFGDFVPGKNTRTLDSNVKRIVCALYLLFGLALLSMIFQLIQDSFTIIVKRYASFLGLSEKQIEKEMEESKSCAESSSKNNKGVLETPTLGKLENGSKNRSEDEIAPNVQRQLRFLSRNAKNLRRESCPESVEGLVYKDRLTRVHTMPPEHHGKKFRPLNSKQLAGDRRELEAVPESQTLDSIKEQLCQK